jgi:HlyD family secretion protein
MEAETQFAKSTIAQAAAVLKLAEAQADFDRTELTRVTALRVGEALPERKLDEQTFRVKSRDLAVEKARADLRLAEAGLVRTQAAVGLKTAEAMLATAEAQLELSVVRAPLAGVVLKVLVRPGEPTTAPILQLGDTANMYVVAEVHANDISVVKIGQRAVITGTALQAEAAGTVEEVGFLIYKNDVLNLDPRAEADTRVVEVRIRMDDATAFAALANLEVFARIDLQPAAAGAEKKSPSRP